MEDKGIVYSIKEWWQSLNFEEMLGDSSTDAIQVSIYFVSFFAIGFLFKKYLKFIFMCLLLTFLIIKGLEYYKILDIDWEAMNTVLGFEPTATFGTILNSLIMRLKENIIISVSAFLGFLVGYKLG